MGPTTFLLTKHVKIAGKLKILVLFFPLLSLQLNEALGFLFRRNFVVFV